MFLFVKSLPADITVQFSIASRQAILAADEQAASSKKKTQLENAISRDLTVVLCLFKLEVTEILAEKKIAFVNVKYRH